MTTAQGNNEVGHLRDRSENSERLIITEELGGRNAYITTDLVDREFEIRARAHVVEIYHKMMEAKSRKRKLIQTLLLHFPREFLNLSFSDVLRDLGHPENFSCVLATIMQMAQKEKDTKNTNRGPILPLQVGTPGCSGASSEVYPLALGKSTSKFTGNSAYNQPKNVQPSTPSKKQGQVKPTAFHTPLQNHVFNFGSINGPPTTGIKKQPRQAKPGETLFTFSATGSPVVATIPGITAKPERIKVDAGNGQMIDVDLVFRGGPPDARKKIATDFRCWAKTRTALQSRKLNPHRPPVKKNGSLSRQQKF